MKYIILVCVFILFSIITGIVYCCLRIGSEEDIRSFDLSDEY